MIDESMDREQMKLPPQPWEFRSKPAWQRLIVMLGGVTVNFILGIFIYSLVLFAWGESYLPTSNAKYGVYADSFANQIGLLSGDKILSIDNEPVDNLREVRVVIFKNESKTIQVKRGDGDVNIDIPSELTGKLASYKGLFIDAQHPCDIESVTEEGPAAKAGLKANDRIIGLNGKTINSFHEFKFGLKDITEELVLSRSRFGTSKKKKVIVPSLITLDLLRGEDTIQTKLTTKEDGTIGFYSHNPSHYFEHDTINYSLGSSFPAGYKKSIEFLGLQINAFGQMFRGKVDARESLGGFRAIGEMFGTTWDWRRFWYMTAVLSLILGFMNLLPIPALDGGHVMFLLYEVITGRTPSDKVMEYSTIVGFIIIISLVLFANINDWL